MVIIDPLKNRLLRYMKLGEANPKSQALDGFGSVEDIEYLEIILKKIEKNKLYNDARKYVYVDLTPPFKMITRKEKIIEKLNEFTRPRPILLVKGGDFQDWINSRIDTKIPILIAEFEDDGQFKKLVGGSTVDKKFVDDVIKDLKWNDSTGLKTNLAEIRQKVAQINLFNLLLSAQCIEFPRNKLEFHKDTIVSDLGREYKILKNGMLVSCYLNLKCLGSSIELLMDAAYEAFLCIEGYFLNQIDQNDFQYIITTNNTALYIASILQSIYEEKTIIPIDKLGPIPSLKINNESLRALLEKKSVILFEEVVGTGSEIDRAIMFLNHMKTDLKRIITLYDLKVGRSLLLNDYITYEALCTPKEELKYEYRSA